MRIVVAASIVSLAVVLEQRFVHSLLQRLSSKQNRYSGKFQGIDFVCGSRDSAGPRFSRAKMSAEDLPSPLPDSCAKSLFFDADDEEILSMDAFALSNAIQKERSVTCEQLMEATLDRIDRINPTLNAIILLRDRDELLQEAKDCDRALQTQWKKGDVVDGESLGWLHGIPVAIKDVSNAQGLPTTMGGSPLFCSESGLEPASFSDPYVEHMVREGAVLIGKTNAPEGGLGSNTFNDKWGKTLNPFGVAKADAANTLSELSAGGSSGGAAVAIATKMLALADGTDNMGSLRNPAGWNAIYSLRPTAGLIPTIAKTNKSTNTTSGNSIPSAASILPHPASTPGPMARTPMDCARLLQTMVGDTEKFRAESPEASESTRIGWLGNWSGQLPMEDGILSTCQMALEDWSASSLGNVQVQPFHGDGSALFDLEKLWEGYNAIRFASTSETYSQQFDVDQLLSKKEGRSLIKEELTWELEQGRSIDAMALRRARAIYDDYEEWLAGIFGGDEIENDDDTETPLDVLALPSAQVWPFPIDERYPKAIGGTSMDTYHRWMEVCVPVSFGGLPCVTIPAGFGANDSESPGWRRPPMPIGIQLFGKREDDGKLLRIADDYYRYQSCRSK